MVVVDFKMLQRKLSVKTLNEKCKTLKNIEKGLSILWNRYYLLSISLFSEKRGDQMQDLINKFETLLPRDKVERCKQVKITSYLVKEK